jgi:hypothetical protein
LCGDIPAGYLVGFSTNLFQRYKSLQVPSLPVVVVVVALVFSKYGCPVQCLLFLYEAAPRYQIMKPAQASFLLYL